MKNTRITTMIGSLKVAIGIFVFAFLLKNARAANQHLICKSVTDVFSEENDRYGRNGTGVEGISAQGKPGKRGAVGPRGLPGIRGVKGEAGYVDYNNISEIVERQVCEGIGGIAAGVNDVRTNIANIQQSIEDLRCSLLGANYKNTCYISPHLSVSQDLTHEEANQTCQEKGFKLAEVHDRTQQQLLEDFIRSKMPSSLSTVYLWIGMTREGSLLRYESGKEVNQNHLVWWPGYPASASNRRLMVLGVRKSESDGVWNSARQSLHGVICERGFNL